MIAPLTGPAPKTKKFYVSHLKQSDAIIIGRQTFNTFHRYPKNSHWYIYTSQPEKFAAPTTPTVQFEATNVPPAELLEQLKAKGYSSVALCGGSSIYSLFLQAGLVDKLYLTVEPLVFGTGIPLFSEDLGKLPLKLVQTHSLSSQTLVLEYEVVSRQTMK
ncbi:dihydrofolate reductase [Candidatus Woesebacteria bacterium]|nr:dihydrofolate reductase [Candidatus Woesebacteria bacterium]